jgi:hypothetical protein
VAASVEALFRYDPIATLADLDLPIRAVIAGGEEALDKRAALAELQAQRRINHLEPIEVTDLGDVGHTVMRYRPAEITAVIAAALAAPLGHP